MSPSQLQAHVIIGVIRSCGRIFGVIRPLKASAGELAAKPSPGPRPVMPAPAVPSR
jgi:hypothetical protein